MARQKHMLTILSCILTVSTIMQHMRMSDDTLSTDEERARPAAEVAAAEAFVEVDHAQAAQACVDDSTTWNAGFGLCSTYGRRRSKNQYWCDKDKSNGVFAQEVCPECNVCQPGPPGATAPFFDWRKITCPVLAMLFRNGDLRTNLSGFISNDTVFRALTRVGVSAFQARSATFGNFDFFTDPTAPSVNLFSMNTGPLGPASQRPKDPSSSSFGAHEHFRSTGIRDDLISSQRFDFTESNCVRPYIQGAGWKNRDIRCATALWDHEASGGGGSGELGFTNDILLPRPVVDGVECGPQDSGLAKCPSALHGSLNAMHQEFGTPTGIRSFVSKEDYRNMWMSAEYPPDFQKRSPRSCVDDSQPSASASGCDFCLQQTSASAGVDFVPNQRYCRCMLQTDLTQGQLEGIAAYCNLGCPTGGNAALLRCFRFNPPDACTAPTTDPLADETLLPSTQQSCEPYCPTNEAFRCSQGGKTFFTGSAGCLAAGGTLVWDQ